MFPVLVVRDYKSSIGGCWLTCMDLFGMVILPVIILILMFLCGCQDLVPRDTKSLFAPRLQRSEIFGFVAGFGTTFAAAPDLIVMLKRRSSAGMNPRMAAIMCVFQILWVYYGLLIASRPVIVWNVLAVLINLFNVLAYRHIVRKEQHRVKMSDTSSR